MQELVLPWDIEHLCRKAPFGVLKDYGYGFRHGFGRDAYWVSRPRDEGDCPACIYIRGWQDAMKVSGELNVPRPSQEADRTAPLDA